jgi:uncharacterized membrane protein YphA (DoxX/SURF4 family)
MGAIVGLMNWGQDLFEKLRGAVDFVAPVMLRIYLVPEFFVAGSNKWNPFAEGGTFNPAEGLKDIAAWFGNPDWGLGLPAPMLMAILAWAAEYLGSICLAFGFAVRWVCIPLLITMIVAATTVHWDNGWQAVHDSKSPHATEKTAEALTRLDTAKSILEEHGNYEWLTEHGNVISSNNGIEWPATYFVMLLALLFLGGGRFFSIDYWIDRSFRDRSAG